METAGAFTQTEHRLKYDVITVILFNLVSRMKYISIFNVKQNIISR